MGSRVLILKAPHSNSSKKMFTHMSVVCCFDGVFQGHLKIKLELKINQWIFQMHYSYFEIRLISLRMSTMFICFSKGWMSFKVPMVDFLTVLFLVTPVGNPFLNSGGVL